MLRTQPRVRISGLGAACVFKPRVIGSRIPSALFEKCAAPRSLSRRPSLKRFSSPVMRASHGEKSVAHVASPRTQRTRARSSMPTRAADGRSSITSSAT
jgi:hypothetical protein